MTPKRIISIAFFGSLGALILSAIGWHEPIVQTIVFAIILGATLVCSLVDIRYGFIIAGAELAIGSQGYIFSLGGPEQGMSVRIGIWVIIMAVWAGRKLISLMRRETSIRKIFSIPFAWPLLALAVSLGISVVVALLYGNDPAFVFLEAKRWLYGLILLPFLQAFRTRDDMKLFLSGFAGAVGALAVTTIGLTYLFSHDFAPFMFDVYTWLRDTLLAEITPGPSGFSRIFAQSQVYLVPACLVGGAWAVERYAAGRKKAAILILSASAVCVTALVASLSRSLWIGTAVAGIVGMLLSAIYGRPRWKDIGRSVLMWLAGLAMAVLVLGLAVRFPFPQPLGQAGLSVLAERANSSEAAAASRWSLLPVMANQILVSPIWGNGLGKTLTYMTSDPRITRTTVNGEYTTYAFEWGWLDVAMKSGLLGLAAYFWLLWSIGVSGFRLIRYHYLAGISVFMGVIAIAAVHFFTPYLNHPLGFMYLAILVAVTQAFAPPVVTASGDRVAKT